MTFTLALHMSPHFGLIAAEEHRVEAILAPERIKNYTWARQEDKLRVSLKR